MLIDLDDFDEVKARAEQFYATLNEVHCPYFKDKVSFNALGLEHLKFKRHSKARSREDQYMRLKLLHLAPEVLKTSATLQGILETKAFVKIRVHSRTDTVMKGIEFYEFIAVIKNYRVKVIVKRIADGQRFFWSIVPYWKVDKTTFKRTLHNIKDSEED